MWYILGLLIFGNSKIGDKKNDKIFFKTIELSFVEFVKIISLLFLPLRQVYIVSHFQVVLQLL